MEHLSVTGIVTRVVDYKESDRILTIFTKELGRVDARAKSCRRTKSPLLPASQPAVFGEFQLFLMGDKYTVDSADVRESFFPLREDVERFAAAAAMLSLTNGTVQIGEPNDALFLVLYHGLSFLCYGVGHPIDLAVCALIKGLNSIGFCPVITSCAICGADLRTQASLRFAPAAGGAVCALCAPNHKPVRPIALEALRRMLLLGNEEMDRVRLGPLLRRELLDLLEDYCAYVLEREQKPVGMLKKLLRKD